ncbi:MAG: DUF883 family protein [Gammaproteobacteria bacterium]
MNPNTGAQTRDDFEDVVETAEELLNTIGDGGGKAVDDLKAKARETLKSARIRLQEATVQARDAANVAAGEADAYVRGNPWMAVAVAGAIGVVLGAALLRRD